MTDFHLQHVRTGETFKLLHDRTLIGAADHATVVTPEGTPYLSACVVRYPTGWAVFGLTDDPSVTYNRQPLRPGQRAVPRRGDLLIVGDERWTFVTPRADSEPPPPPDPPHCFVYIRNPDGMEEVRAVDHDLLFGRSAVCHVQLAADTRLSRFAALLAAHNGVWYLHTLSKKPNGRNRKAVPTMAPVENGDELLIGPLVVRVEIRGGSAEKAALPAAASPDPAASPKRSGASKGAHAGATDFGETTDDGTGAYEPTLQTDVAALREGAQQLERWLRQHEQAAGAPKAGGLGGWFGAQRDKLRRFWLDTPETTAARGHRTAGRYDEAFAILDRAIRARPDGPELLRELYRLYEAAGLIELCYRPLRQIEKLADARGAPDAWVLETLAKLCEQLSVNNPSMADRAIAYWHKLEAATGTSYHRQRSDVMARRALREGGYPGDTGSEE